MEETARHLHTDTFTPPIVGSSLYYTVVFISIYLAFFMTDAYYLLFMMKIQCIQKKNKNVLT